MSSWWMWSGGTVADTTLVQGFDPTPGPDGIFRKLSSPFFQTTDLTTIHQLVNCDVMLK
jgi:hypothetical protein